MLCLFQTDFFDATVLFFFAFGIVFSDLLHLGYLISRYFSSVLLWFEQGLNIFAVLESTLCIEKNHVHTVDTTIWCWIAPSHRFAPTVTGIP